MLGAGHVRCSDPPPPSSWLGQGLGLGFGSGSRRDLANATGLLPGPLPNTHSPVRTLSCPPEAVEPILGMRRPRLPSSRLPPTVTPFMQRRPLPRTSPSGRPPPTEMPDCRLPRGLRPAPPGLRPQASAPHCVRTPDMETCRTEPRPGDRARPLLGHRPYFPVESFPWERGQ